jgi:hypothetical protein
MGAQMIVLFVVTLRKISNLLDTLLGARVPSKNKKPATTDNCGQWHFTINIIGSDVSKL